MCIGLRAAGAAYLVYLGVRALGAAIWPRPAAATTAPAGRSGELTPWAAFRQGLLCNLGNPKAAVFFLSLLPQFVGGTSPYAATVLLGLIAAALTFASVLV